MIRKIFTLTALSVLFFACKKDNETATIPLRDYTEVATENDLAIQNYLKTHFYNFETQTIEALTQGSSQTPLLNMVKTRTLKLVTSSGQEVPHKMYYLITREGNGQQATIADNAFLTYVGRKLNNEVFDQSVTPSTANWLDLLGNRGSNSGSIFGFREAVALLKDSASDLTLNEQGFLTPAEDYGKGIFFIPSGVAYFNSSIKGDTYAPLIFEIGLIKTKRADHDADGIPSIEEIQYNQNDGSIILPDCNFNGTPDYLDARKCK